MALTLNQRIELAKVRGYRIENSVITSPQGISYRIPPDPDNDSDAALDTLVWMIQSGFSMYLGPKYKWTTRAEARADIAKAAIQSLEIAGWKNGDKIL